MNKVSKQKFIDCAQSLDGAYYDYGRCLYIITHASGIDEQVFIFMVNEAHNVNEVDKKVYELLGEPSPLPIVSDACYDYKRVVAV